VSRRILKINQLIKTELAKTLLREMGFPSNVLVTITRVEVNSDLSEAKVYISVFPEKNSKEVFKTLNKEIYDLQQLLNKKLVLRRVPKIRFLKEEKTKTAGEIEAILERLKKEEK